MPLSNWKPPDKRTNEDNMLLKYWEKTGGRIYTEVFVGRGGIQKYARGEKPRRIGGVQIIAPNQTDDIISFYKNKNLHEFQLDLSGEVVKVNVLEMKRSLDRFVLGQVMVGADLLEMEYNLTHVGQIAICEFSDPVLEAVCKNRNIEVWIPSMH